MDKQREDLIMAGNKAVGKTLKILEVISKHPEGISLSGIAKETKYPKSTVFDILEALYEADAIFYKDYVRKTYVIGAKLYAIGQNYMSQSNFISISSQPLQEFSRKYNLICYGCKMINKQVVYVYNTHPDNYKLNPHPVGSSYPLEKSMIGKVFLAFMNKVEFEETTEDYDKNKKEEVQKEGQEITNRGYVTGYDRDFKSIFKCAIPVFNFENKVVAAIAFVQLRENNVGLDEQIENFIKIAQLISYKQGYGG